MAQPQENFQIQGRVVETHRPSRARRVFQTLGNVARGVGHRIVEVARDVQPQLQVGFRRTPSTQIVQPVTEQPFEDFVPFEPQQDVTFRLQLPFQQTPVFQSRVQAFETPTFTQFSNATQTINGAQTLQRNPQTIFQAKQGPSLHQDPGQLLQQPQAELPVDVVPQRAFQPVQEDLLFTPIQQLGSRPISSLERLQIEQQRQQTQAYQQAAQHVLRQAAQPQPTRRLPVELPKAERKGENLWKKVNDGEPLTDKDLKQLFHSVDLTQYQEGGNDPMVFAFKKAVAIEAVVNNQLQHLETDEHGNPLVHGVPVDNPREWLKRDLEHFYEHDTHLSPNAIRAEAQPLFVSGDNPVLVPLPNLNSPLQQQLSKTAVSQTVHPGFQKRLPVIIPNNYRREDFQTSPDLPLEQYKDITQNVHAYDKHISTQVLPLWYVNTPAFINFRSGEPWDLKGQPGLPLPGQWAIYRGMKVHDAFIANRIFGKVMARSVIDNEQSLTVAQIFSFFSRKGELDQPEDQAAIISGYLEEYGLPYWNSKILRPTYFEQLKKQNKKAYDSFKGLEFKVWIELAKRT